MWSYPRKTQEELSEAARAGHTESVAVKGPRSPGLFLDMEKLTAGSKACYTSKSCMLP